MNRDHVVHALTRAVQLLASDSTVTIVAFSAAKELVMRLLDLVRTRGVDGANELLKRMYDAPASKVDLSPIEAEVQAALAAREAAEAEETSG